MQQEVIRPLRLTLFISLALLIPSLALPFGSDQSTFALIGKALVGGARLYDDVVEQKPPLIYLIYAGLGLVSGFSTIGYRVMDIIIQLFMSWGIFTLIYRRFKSSQAASFSSITYVALYMIAGFSETMQCESFLSPLLLGILWIGSLGYQTKRTLLLLGLFCGVAFSLKFTFGVLFIAVLGTLVPSLSDWHTRMKQAGLVLSGFLVGAFIGLWPLAIPSVFDSYLQTLQFTSNYAKYPAINAQFITFVFEKLGSFFGDNFSLGLLGAVFVGLFMLFRRYPESPGPIQDFSTILLTTCAALLFSVLFERKMNHYHIMRLCLPLAMLSGLGLSQIVRSFKDNWWQFSPQWKVLVAIWLGFVVFFSPLPRVARLYLLVYLKATDEYGWAMQFQKPDSSGMAYWDLLKTVEFLESQPNKNYYAVNWNASWLYNNVPTQIRATLNYPAFYYSVFAPQGYKQRFHEEIRKADIIVSQSNDSHPNLMGHSLTSAECLETMDKALLDSLGFRRTRDLGVIVIYERTRQPDQR